MSKYSKLLLGVAGFLVLFLLIFHLPNHAADNSHDYGSQAAIEYWVKNNLRFGIDVIQNVGPYGFIMYPLTYTGILDFQKFLINITLTGLFVYLMLSFASGKTKTINFLLYVLLALFAYQDTYFYLFFLMITHSLLQIRKNVNNIVEDIFLISALVLLGLAKGTFFVLSMFLVFVLGATHILNREYVLAGYRVLIYTTSFMAFWIYSGQNLQNIPEFVEGIFSFSSGYNEAMQIYETIKTTIFGVVLVLLMFALSAWRLLKKYQSKFITANTYAFFLVETAILYVLWKHAYVRADAHVIALIYYAVIFSFISIWYFDVDFSFKDIRQAKIKQRSEITIKAVATILVFSIAFVCFKSLKLFTLTNHLEGRSRELANKIGFIMHPRDYIDSLQTKLSKNVSMMQTENIYKITGIEKIAYLGMLPGFMVYNNFNYIPTPSTISFAAWNKAALVNDFNFFAHAESRPKYVIFSAMTIDNRFSPQDDSLAKLELLNSYDPILTEKDNLLLIKKEAPMHYSFSKLSKQNVRVGDWVVVPESNDPIWLMINFDKSIVSRIGGIVYKPAEYLFEYKTNEGQEHREKLIPKIAETGFLINPIISTNKEFISAKSESQYQKYLHGYSNELRKILMFRINCGHLEKICNKRYQVEFSKVNGLGLGNIDSQHKAALNASVLNVKADVVSFDTKYPVRSVIWDGKDVTLFHAPGKLVLQKPLGKYKLTGQYGMLPSAYESGGSSDGVMFTVKFQSVDTENSIFQQKLDPVKNTKDRGFKTINIELPNSAGEITLEINSINNFNYDHFFFYGLTIEPQ